MKLYTCDVQILGKGQMRGYEVWLSMNSQAEAKKTIQALFPNDKVVSVQNVKEKRK